ncbi:hypothetical protein LB505_005196 [Fusarium chuoi]|nr:hypothetical protein LB505_005196 [Fusarium chuoi]
MIGNLWGNPHSENLPAKLSGDMVDNIRAKALDFVGADPKYFDLVFVANATAAIKLVADAFRDIGEKTPTKGFWKPTPVSSGFAHLRQGTIIVSKMMRVLKNGSRGRSAASPEGENRPVWACSHIQASPILVDDGYHRTGPKEYGSTLNFEMSIPFSMLRLSP